MSVLNKRTVFGNPFYFFGKLILLSLVLFICQPHAARSQSCTSCTYTISSNSSTSYTLTAGQKLCITSSGTYTGSVTLSGGTICVQGSFTPSSFAYNSGNFDNYGSATVGSISLSQTSTTLTNYSGATLTINTSFASSSSGASFINNGTASIGTSFAVSGGTFTNGGSISVGTTTAVSGGSFTNTGSFTAHGISPSGGTFTNSSSGIITNTGDFANSAIGGSNAGTISNTGNFTNSGTFTSSASSIISCVNFSNNGGTITLSGGIINSTNFTNSGTINGPTSGNGCGTIKATTTTTNSGTINNYADICDATPPSGTIKIDANSGTVASTVTFCSCCLLNTPSISGTSTICNGASTTLTASSGTSYSWSTSATTQAITVSPTATTTYTVTITYANSCTRTATQTVTVNPKPSANAGSNVSYCTGGSASIGGTATGGTTPYTYAWSPSTGLSSTTVASPTASPTSTTTYTLTVTDNKGCTGTSSITITVNSKPTASAGSNVTICSGSSTAIGGNPTASGGTSPYTYSWVPSTTLSSTTTANPTANPTSTTTYTLTVTDNNGCVGTTSTVTVTVNPVPTVSGGSNATICQNNTVTIGGNPSASGGTSPYIYSWLPFSGLNFDTVPNPTATPNGTSTYTLTVTDHNSCSSSASITVTVNPRPTVFAGVNSSICIGGSVTLGSDSTASGSVPPYTYSWSPSTALSSVTIAKPVSSSTSTITYTVIVTDHNTCSNSASIQVTVNPKPAASAGPDTTICSGGSFYIGGSPTATGGTPLYTYSWSPQTDLNAVNIDNPLMTPVSARSYTVTVTDVNGCSSTASKNVTVNTSPTVTPNTTANAICIGSGVTLTGSGAQTYQWTNGVSNGVAFTPDMTRPYYVTGTDSHGCTSTSSVTVTVNSLPAVGAGASTNTVCSGSSVILNGTGAQTYSWSGGVTNGSAFTPTSTNTYTVTGTDANGCSNTSSITVSVVPALSVNAGSDATIYAGNSVSIGGNPSASAGTAPYTYSWSPAVGLNSAQVANPTAKSAATTTYSLTVSDSQGCTAASSVTVTVNAVPAVNMDVQPSTTMTGGNANTIYIGRGAQSLTLTASVSGNVQSYSWSPSTALSCTNCLTTVASPAATTTYTFTATGANGGVTNVTVTIYVVDLNSACSGCHN